jgi:hypothetical protein
VNGLVPAVRLLGRADPEKEIGVTVVVRRSLGSPLLPTLEDWQSTPLSWRRALSREEYARTYGADQADEADLDKVRAFASTYGLKVTESHAGRRAITLEERRRSSRPPSALRLITTRGKASRLPTRRGIRGYIGACPDSGSPWLRRSGLSAQ